MRGIIKIGRVSGKNFGNLRFWPRRVISIFPGLINLNDLLLSLSQSAVYDTYILRWFMNLHSGITRGEIAGAPGGAQIFSGGHQLLICSFRQQLPDFQMGGHPRAPASAEGSLAPSP